MSSARFSIAYDGPALRDNVMNVRDLAPALLAVGQLFDAANEVLNGEVTKVNISVTATNHGSFEVFLELSQTPMRQIVDFFSGDTVTAAINMKEFIVGGAGAGIGLIWLIKKLKGRKPDKVEKTEDGRIRITVGGENFVAPIELLRLYQDFEVRDALQKLVEAPLMREGIDTFRVRDGEHGDTVSEEESAYFSAPEVEQEIVLEDKRISAFSIISLTFKDNNKWRLHDGVAPISAPITDERFLGRVNSNEIAFSKGDILICEVKMTQIRTRDGLKTEYVVERVVEHQPAARQTAMNLVSIQGDSE